ncbi:HNH endonuclease [Leptospira kmetyi]|uniref:HNH endonuclease n=1 Tax=Leptospira kmetyi TaxID=408139 RepID=UPI000C299363|nr:HNH endonuclease [Leptospira kmetyi]PJZ39581.1 HNH endonuclease [Leptospira kmetyi]TGK16767.1 HNH endonuclease [Leptospira kmetyi]TGK33142.1 HNH endonuclease [Leptospira kmetyi]TGL70639.1 HNH endonuclease [Leptospira kmetyi]
MEPEEEPIVWISEEELAKQRRIAKDLKKTPWWKKKKGAGVCHYCGRKFPPEELTMDHLIPLAKGGKSIKANLVPACKECNFAKKNKLPFEFDSDSESGRTQGGPS